MTHDAGRGKADSLLVDAGEPLSPGSSIGVSNYGRIRTKAKTSQQRQLEEPSEPAEQPLQAWAERDATQRSRSDQKDTGVSLKREITLLSSGHVPSPVLAETPHALRAADGPPQPGNGALGSRLAAHLHLKKDIDDSRQLVGLGYGQRSTGLKNSKLMKSAQSLGQAGRHETGKSKDLPDQR